MSELLKISGFTGNNDIFAESNLLNPNAYYPSSKVNEIEANNPDNEVGALRFLEGRKLYDAMAKQYTDRAWLIRQESGRVVVARNVFPVTSSSRFETTFTLAPLYRDGAVNTDEVLAIYNDGFTGGWGSARTAFEGRLEGSALSTVTLNLGAGEQVRPTPEGLTLVTNRLVALAQMPKSGGATDGTLSACA